MATGNGAPLERLPSDLRHEVVNYMRRPDANVGPSTDELALSAVSTAARADYRERHPQDAKWRQTEVARLDKFMTRVRSGQLTLGEVIDAIKTADPRIVGAPIAAVDQGHILMAVRKGLMAIRNDESALLAALHRLITALSETCAGTARLVEMEFVRFADNGGEDTGDSDSDSEGLNSWNLVSRAGQAHYHTDQNYYGPESAVMLNLYTMPPPALPNLQIGYNMRRAAPRWPSLPDTYDHVRRIGQDRAEMFRGYLTELVRDPPVDLAYGFEAEDAVFWAVGAVTRCCLFSNDAARGVRLHQEFIDMQAFN